MIALVLLVVAYTLAPESLRLIAAPLRPILVLETLLIVVFGVSWFDKGRELAAKDKYTIDMNSKDVVATR